MFEVGKLAVFHPALVDSEHVIDKLHATQCFRQVNSEFVDALKCYYQVFVDRVDTAVKGSDENYWSTLCNEPRSKLKNLWKVKKETGKGPKSEEQKRIEYEKSLMQAMYYCLYVVLFWRHDDAPRRYKRCATTLTEFRSVYEKDCSFPKERMDKWETLFAFRNVMLLAAAVKPSARNKGLFAKIGCILAEDRIHAMGGGQSFAADRRGYIYDKEGATFVLSSLHLDENTDKNSLILNLGSKPPLTSDALGGKRKLRIDGPPTLSRNSSLSQPSKQSKTGTDVSDDVSSELDLLLNDDSFTADLLRNMSLQNLSDLCPADTIELKQPTIPINLHSAYVVGRAFSYNAYHYNSHGETPLLGAATEETAVMDLSSSSECSFVETPLDRLSPTDHDHVDSEEIGLIRDHSSTLAAWEI